MFYFTTLLTKGSLGEDLKVKPELSELPHSALAELPSKCRRLSCPKALQVTRMADRQRRRFR